MKPSLIIDARLLFCSGIGTYTRSLLSHLEMLSSFTITLLLPQKESQKAFQISSASQVFFEEKIYTLKEQIRFPLLVKKYDLLWIPYTNIPIFPTLSHKTAVTVHDVCPLELPEHFSHKKRVGAKLLLSKTVQKSDLLLTVSSFSKERILSFFPKAVSKLHIAPCSVQKAHPKKIQGIDFDFPFILYVGNIKPFKNVEKLIEAFLKLEDSSLKLVLAGSLFVKYLPLPPQVLLLEGLSDEEIAFLYQKALMLVHPSLYEGFGITPLEAMAQSCPVVCSNRASLPEVCGNAAEYVDPSSIESLQKGMLHLLKNPQRREELIVKGHQRVLNFSWETSAKYINQLFLKEVSI